MHKAYEAPFSAPYLQLKLLFAGSGFKNWTRDLIIESASADYYLPQLIDANSLRLVKPLELDSL